jgi:phosphomannomutase
MSVFHAYDIRGLSPQELDESFANRLGLAIAKQFSPRRVIVGRDMRATSSALESALIEGLTGSGIDVVRIGLCSTPMFNVIVGLSNGDVDLGVMVTASHNPGQYNGIKLVRGDASPIGQGSGMEELADAFASMTDASLSEKKGTISEDSGALSRYVDHILKLAALPSNMPKMRIAIDAGNGMAGAVLPELIARLPWLEVTPLYFELDGNFPNHEANPLKRETLNDLVTSVQSQSFMLGVAFDGDADRVGFVDEYGQPIPGDLGTALIAQEVLRTSPGGLVLYDIRSSWSVPEAIAEAGGRSKMCRVGHAYIKRQMRETGAVFAGEISMHYYFHPLKFVESGDLVLLYVLRRMVREQKRLSELWRPLAKYAHSGEINFEIEDKESALQRVHDTYASTATSVSDLDGIRMEFRNQDNPEHDWWFSVRLSNTEPLVRLNLETRSSEETKKRVEELTALIKK